MIYEILLNAKILGYLLRYTSANYLNHGIAYSPNILEKLALDWISLIMPNLSMTVPKKSIFYRVQRSLHAPVNKDNLNNPLLMRNTDIEYVGTGRFNRPGSWYLYLASDIDTAVKEIRLQGNTFFSARFVVKKEFSCLDVRESSVNLKLDYKNRHYNLVIYDGANLPLYVLLSSGLYAMKNYVKSISSISDDAKRFQQIYFISQSVADVAKKNGLHAIKYDSTRNPSGVDLSFFDKKEIDGYFIQEKTVQHKGK
jgi:hypothetical protein